MSVTIIPGQFHDDPHPVGRLASALLSVAVAGMADPARFRRGKLYVSDRAVTRLHVSPGELVATVVGSRDEPYQVVVAVRTIDRPVLGSPEALRSQINRITPEGGDLMVSCTCPDWDDPCKHAVAALLAFAAELTSRPELLVEWRCTPSAEANGGRAQVGSRARGSERHLRLAPALPQTRTRAPEPPAPWEEPEWRTFLGVAPPEPPTVPSEPATIGRASLGIIDLGHWVRSAIDELGSHR